MREFQIDIPAYLTIRGRAENAEAFLAKVRALGAFQTVTVDAHEASHQDLLASGLEYAEFGTVETGRADLTEIVEIDV